MELYFNSPNTPSWRCEQLKHRGNFTFTFDGLLASQETLCTMDLVFH